MFEYSKAILLDLSSFDTSNVTDMIAMFQNSQVNTIYVSDKWNTFKVRGAVGVFEYSFNLVGGAGTRYNSTNPADKTYARVDGGTSNPGYFTLKAN